ncbi:putative zinc-binding metallopeptidase [Oceanirhabdus sp. W0125-5]|uniref:putative zinc-binding metallopeptidase n=1 Tax=Oceanirhabdus sp. W0125-5 TaxID=2999116 RepID=UPI0022F32463|nr:putative zinc-binding metallopeptidase [Oceanirhabdus sp. W0125-5]WBW96453.1 putative zinc-binding metallopeptidase [Oceanirhabdus sp. W0125-5]
MKKRISIILLIVTIGFSSFKSYFHTNDNYNYNYNYKTHLNRIYGQKSRRRVANKEEQGNVIMNFRQFIESLKEKLKTEDYNKLIRLNEELDSALKEDDTERYQEVTSEIFEVISKYGEYLLFIHQKILNGEVLAAFNIVKGDIVVNNHITNKNPSQENIKSYELLWERIKNIIPKSYIGKITDFNIITDGKANVLASVSGIDSIDKKWEINVDKIDSIRENGQLDCNELNNTIIHEFAHILTLNSSQIEGFINPNSDNYQTGTSTTKQNSYLNKFYQRFWKNIYDEWKETNETGDLEEKENFYKKYKNQFVSEYASTNIEEDIAETFTQFVTQDKPKGKSIKEKKILFFYKYRETIELREEIRANLKKLSKHQNKEEVINDLGEFIESIVEKLKFKDFMKLMESYKEMKSAEENQDYDKVNGVYIIINEILEKYDYNLDEVLESIQEQRYLASFNIINGELSINEEMISKEYSKENLRRYQLLWERVKNIIPKSHIERIIKFSIDTDGQNNVMAYVNEEDTTSEDWRLTIDKIDAIKEDDQLNNEELNNTIVHEFGHILTLNNTQVEEGIIEDSINYCTETATTKDNSYLNKFYYKFWKGINEEWIKAQESEEAKRVFYENNIEHFVTEYASTNILEDIAESFTAFVLQDKPKGKNISEKKILFFYDFKETIKMRNEIRENLKKMESLK